MKTTGTIRGPKTTLRTRPKPPIWAAALLLVVLTTPILTAQTATVYHIPGIYYQEYTPESSYSESFDFTVAQQGSGALDFFVTVDGGDAGSFDPRYATASDGSQLRYYVYDNLNDRNILRSGTNLDSKEVITGSFSSGQSYAQKTKSYAVFVPAGQYAANATYEDELTFTVYTGTPDNYDPTTAVTESVPITLAVPRSIAVRLNDPGGSFPGGNQTYSLDFGSLFDGETREIDLLVNSTVNYYVAFSSNNSGAMSRTGGSATVNYTMLVDGSTVDLSSGYTEAISGESPTISGPRAYRMKITIGGVDGLPAGTYEDTVTIDVVSQ